ncbi:C40 family peptidase [Mycobacterium avium]|uniref:C40 family peptidase n=1 Tax=Mycobacterium avium TaxID=1764 RepID=UPI0015DCF173|nr:NlpC/P60 family protein [Mycobacterium avium]APA78451.3 C40 family peptidase [Mycobacterium avium subsp. hominissuis]
MAATALDNKNTHLGGADHALDGFSRTVAADTATSRKGADDVIVSANKTTAALAPYTNTLAGRVALASSLTDHVAAAGDLVTGYGSTLPGRQQQLTAIGAQYAPTTPPPGTPPGPGQPGYKPRRRRPRRPFGRPRGLRGGGAGGGYPARYQLAGAFKSFQPPQFSVPSLGGGGGGFSPSNLRLGDAVGPGGGPGPVPGLPDGDGSLGSRAVNFASEKLGKMYLWGGKGGPEDNGRVDCSGLTHWAYKRLGIEIGPNTYTQIGKGFQVPPSAIRPGDLIFCNFGEGGNPGPGHVVMATGYGANSRIIEASHDGAPVAFSSMPKGKIVVKRIVA